MTAVGFEPTPLRNGALSHYLRPLGQTVFEMHGDFFNIDYVFRRNRMKKSWSHEGSTTEWLPYQPKFIACPAQTLQGIFFLLNAKECKKKAKSTKGQCEA